jgi:hypothetical protein
MMDAHVLETLRKNAVVYIKDENGTFIPLGVGSTVSLTQDGCSATTMVLEVQDIPTLKPQKPENIISFDAEGLTMSTCCSANLFWQYPPPKFGKSFVEENKTIYTSTADILKEKEEGNNMDLLDLYEEKSKENIDALFDEAIKEIKEQDVISKDVKDFYDTMDKNLEALKEKYSQDNAELYGGYLDVSTNFDLNITHIQMKNEEIERLKKEKEKWLKDLETVITEVRANLDMISYNETCDEYKEKMQVLRNFDIIDNAGHLNPVGPFLDENDFEEEKEPSFKVEETTAKVEKKRGRPKKESN